MNQTHKEIKSTKLTFTETPKAEIYPVKDPNENGCVDRGNPVKSPEVKVITRIAITHRDKEDNLGREQSAVRSLLQLKPEPAN